MAVAAATRSSVAPQAGLEVAASRNLKRKAEPAGRDSLNSHTSESVRSKELKFGSGFFE